MVVVPEGSDQFGVDLALELVPGEVGVVGVRHDAREVVPYLLRVELLQHGLHVPGYLGFGIRARALPALGELAAVEHQVLVRRDVVGQVEALLCAHEHRRPDDGMERDVVLADEVVMPAVGVLPEGLPVVGLPDLPGVLHSHAEVPDDSVEPDVDDLLLPLLAFDGDLDAPLHVPGDGAVLQAALQEVLRVGADVGPPVGLVLEVLHQGLLEGRELQEVLLRGLHDGGGAAAGAVRVDDVAGLEGGAAAVALVGADVLGAADGALALHVAVRQELPAFGAVVLVLVAGVDVPVVKQRLEKPLGHLDVDGGVGLPVEGVADPQVLDRLLVDFMVAVGHLLGGDALLLGGDGDGRPVLIGAADDPDLVAQQAVVAGEDVRREEGPGHMPQVDGAVGVRPRDVHEYLRHGRLMGRDVI